MADKSLVAPVSDGSVVNTGITKSSSLTGDSSLGKDAFLQLLVTQMQYQDPLNPNTDTQFVAQLAQFSQLEQLQNLNSTYTHSQAFSMVGKYVIIETKNSNGNTVEVDGRVDFVTKLSGETYLSVGGSLYPLSEVQSLLDDEFVDILGLPAVEKKDAEFDFEKAEDIKFEIDLGSGKNAAKNVTGIKVDGKELDEKMYYVNSEGVVKIDATVFTGLPNGKYKVEVSFDDEKKTTVSDMVTVTVKNSTVEYPSAQTVKAELDFADPKDLEIALSLGKGNGAATGVTIKIGDNELTADDYSLDEDGKLIIKQSALTYLSNGTYPVELTFNNKAATEVKDKITLTVTNSTV